MEKKEAICLKGCRDGVRVIVSPDADIRDVLDSLHAKSMEYRSFFKGSCTIIVTGRRFLQSDRLRINSILSAILPDCPVVYEEEEITRPEKRVKAEDEVPDEDIFSYDEKKKAPGFQKAILKFFGAKDFTDFEEDEIVEENTQTIDKMIEVRGRLCEDIYIYNGTVRKNNRLRAPGNLLIIGDTEPGAEVVAIGSIYVFGKVRGRIWAGCNGDDKASIIAYDLAPDEMRISDIYLRLPNGTTQGRRRPEKAYLLKDTIYIDEYL